MQVLESTTETQTKSPSKVDSYKLFNRISSRYDFLNHFLSAGQDIRWRKKTVQKFKNIPNQTILDLATGTADLILSAFKTNSNIVRGIGLDPAADMLLIGQKKSNDRDLSKQLVLAIADGTDIPLPDHSVHGAMIAFGIRNIADMERCLQEIWRVLKPGGRLLVLEFSLPRNRIIRNFYLVYFRYILPKIGGIISGDKNAYQYLNQTVESFYYGQAFCKKLQEAGFQCTEMIPLSFGIATIYVGDKDDLRF